MRDPSSQGVPNCCILLSFCGEDEEGEDEAAPVPVRVIAEAWRKPAGAFWAGGGCPAGS